jgi:hypothetical protein
MHALIQVSETQPKAVGGIVFTGEAHHLLPINPRSIGLDEGHGVGNPLDCGRYVP